MFTADDGQTFYEGDCRAGDREATAEEVADVMLGRAKASKIGDIAAAFAARIAAGMPCRGKVLQIREADRNIITAVFGRAKAYLDQAVTPLPDGVVMTWPPGGYPWRMLDDSWETFSPAEFMDMSQQLADYYGALFYVSRGFKDAVMAAQSVEGVAAIDITTGWPGAA